LGRKAENAVAIELKRRDFEVFYWKGEKGAEVDFVARKGAEITPINVCYSEKPAERELKSLVEFAWKFRRVKTPILLSAEKREGREEKGGIEIEMKNLEKWLLERT